jgi:hypothetical protein
MTGKTFDFETHAEDTKAYLTSIRAGVDWLSLFAGAEPYVTNTRSRRTHNALDDTPAEVNPRNLI